MCWCLSSLFLIAFCWSLCIRLGLFYCNSCSSMFGVFPWSFLCCPSCSRSASLIFTFSWFAVLFLPQLVVTDLLINVINKAVTNDNKVAYRWYQSCSSNMWPFLLVFQLSFFLFFLCFWLILWARYNWKGRHLIGKDLVIKMSNKL